MIFEQLTLNNFGIYQGEHKIDLDSTDHEKPIILFGGLNGGGKTTFLDSLQLALYGKHAKCSNRGRLPYGEYLKQAINRSSVDKSASVALRFRHKTGTKQYTYEIIRSWSMGSNRDINDTIQVNVDGLKDNLLTDSWDDFVSEFIPQSLSSLFFFDGEKIEDLADPSRSAQLIQTGIEALLGLELFTQLSKDLNNQRQRKQEKNLDNKANERVQELLARKDILENNFKEKEAEIEIILTDHDNLSNQLDNMQFELQSSGANLLDSLSEIQVEEKGVELKIEATNNSLIKAAGSALPLLLAKDLFQKTKQQTLKEQASIEQLNAKKYIIEQNNALLETLSSTSDNLTVELVKVTLDKLMSDSESKNTTTECYLNSNSAIFDFAYNSLKSEAIECRTLIEEKSELIEKNALLKKKLEAIPDYDSVKDQIKEKQKLELLIEQKTHQLEATMEERNQCKNQLHELEGRLDATLVQQSAENFEQLRNKQVAEHLDEMKAIIDSFKSNLINENIAKLESKIKSKFTQLERKSNLIARIEINPKTFHLTLIDGDNKPLEPKRLSAGERQLLSVAILWALADESGKEIPTIIDTPMGRLDGKHRTKLVEDYFPQAAGQVLLLSTDEEITGQYYKKLKPYISKEYHISYNESLKTSTIQPGYFVEEV
ncbi:DNA sulfur modification protein DndD [Aliivibrio wodanis]|uniref:DNA sulfur modification protein DndD n=1 Tax=Aliivibrio wodanis TaxID=80852 RepID=UPI00406D2584